MTESSWKKVNKRNLNAITRQRKKKAQELYISIYDKEVQKLCCKQDKRNFVEQLTKEAEEADGGKGDIKSLPTSQGA